ncbi:response regulator transcription factor [Castellaniella sp. MT123]|uniref:response regulator transcription factor n=1 Tax=Castellaniella sp. MT123 TaxID=3140381 RepID=UPI0031F3B892
MRILLVEDAADVAEAIVACTRRMGHDTDWESNGKRAAERVLADCYDLLILDVMLPDMDGLALLQRVRGRKLATQVLMLTARGEIEERVEALDMGANDYLVKPFDFRELEARVRALLRQGSGTPTNLLSCANLTIDRKSRTVQLDGLALDLTRREVMLLELLVARPGRIFSKDELIDRLFGIDDNPNANTVEQHVARLRKKLAGARFTIRTLRGLGYQVVVP